MYMGRKQKIDYKKEYERLEKKREYFGDVFEIIFAMIVTFIVTICSRTLLGMMMFPLMIIAFNSIGIEKSLKRVRE